MAGLFSKIKDKRDDKKWLENYDKETERLERIAKEARLYGSKGEHGVNWEAEEAEHKAREHKQMRMTRFRNMQTAREEKRSTMGKHIAKHDVLDEQERLKGTAFGMKVRSSAFGLSVH